MMPRDELLQWITGLPEDAEIGIDDGGWCLQTKTGEDYLEIGGLPEELDDYEAANSTPTFVYGDRVKCSAEGLNTFTKYTSTMRGVIVSKRRIWPPQAN